eukprot:1155204-Pelagomonas_calceolata.AAC.3
MSANVPLPIQRFWPSSSHPPGTCASLQSKELAGVGRINAHVRHTGGIPEVGGSQLLARTTGRSRSCTRRGAWQLFYLLLPQPHQKKGSEVELETMVQGTLGGR